MSARPREETFPFSDRVAAALPEEVRRSSWDPTPGPYPRRSWWSRPLELARLVADPVYYGVGVPRGDRTPVVLVPGFLAGDTSLAVLQDWLRRLGYQASSAGVA
jgi:triacylglycerol esterase/lipase EstA (alpha/beta hydrolase family)